MFTDISTQRKSRGIDISPREAGCFRMATADQLRVGTRVRVYARAISSIGGQCGTIVRVVERGLYTVRADSGMVRNIARWDLALETK